MSAFVPWSLCERDHRRRLFFLDCKETTSGLIESYEKKGFEIVSGAGSDEGMMRMVEGLYEPPPIG